MAKEFSVIGKRFPQPDAAMKATGAANFVADITIADMLTARILRSPYPHARVKKIDTSKAKKLPGVAAVITAADVPDKPYMTFAPRTGSIEPPIRDRHILENRARYVGDNIAAVAATDRWIAEEALELIEVEYEILPAVFDVEDALKPGAPRIDDIAENNIAYESIYALAEGDVEKGLAESDLVIEETFSTKPQEHCLLEPHSCIAALDANGKLTCWTACQLPHLARRTFSELFDLPLGNIRVLNHFAGGSFGKRLPLFSEPIAVALALKTGKPVKLEYTIEEEFAVVTVRPAFNYTVRAGFKNDGTLHAMHLDVIGNSGGYRGSGALIIGLALYWGLGAYRCPNRAGKARAVFTNIQGAGSMRGLGCPEITFGVEQVMDMAAEKLSIDPLEIRFTNIKKIGEPGSMGCTIESTAQAACITSGAEKIKWREKRATQNEGVYRRGVGMATAQYCSGGFPSILEVSSAFIKFNEDGSVNLLAHPGSAGTGAGGVICMIVAEILALRIEDVHLVTGDTDITMFDMGSHASRSAYSMGNAAMRAALSTKEMLLEKAGKMLAVPPSDLDVKDRHVYEISNPDKNISFQEICETVILKSGVDADNICGKATWHSRSNAPPFGAYFAEVGVDTDTGVVKLIKLVTAGDVGRPLNPMTVEGHFEGCMQQFAGYALSEDWCINKDTGVLQTNGFNTYKMLTQLDMPDTEVILADNPDPSGPFGAKGAGELGGSGIAAAIANAIYHAIGIRMKDLPITPEKIMGHRGFA